MGFSNCRRCLGYGWYNFVVRVYRGVEVTERRDCDLCGGRGFIVVSGGIV